MILLLMVTSIDCDLQTASRLATHLRKEGYIIPAVGSKKRGSGTVGKQRYSTTKAEPALTRMMKQYFDPTAKIAHHVRTVPSDTLHSTRLTSSSSNCPHPTTL